MNKFSAFSFSEGTVFVGMSEAVVKIWREKVAKVIYVWKIIENLVPGCGITVTHDSETRLGRIVGAANLRRVSNLTESTFQVQASKLFNSLPKCLRNLTKCEVGDFKAQLDTYLSTLYDEPPSPGHTPRGLTLTGHSSNSIVYQKTKSVTNLEITRRNMGESDRRRRQPGHWWVMEKKACKWLRENHNESFICVDTETSLTRLSLC